MQIPGKHQHPKREGGKLPSLHFLGPTRRVHIPRREGLTNTLSAEAPFRPTQAADSRDAAREERLRRSEVRGA